MFLHRKSGYGLFLLWLVQSPLNPFCKRITNVLLLFNKKIHQRIVDLCLQTSDIYKLYVAVIRFPKKLVSVSKISCTIFNSLWKQVLTTFCDHNVKVTSFLSNIHEYLNNKYCLAAEKPDGAGKLNFTTAVWSPGLGIEQLQSLFVRTCPAPYCSQATLSNYWHLCLQHTSWDCSGLFLTPGITRGIHETQVDRTWNHCDLVNFEYIKDFGTPCDAVRNHSNFSNDWNLWLNTYYTHSFRIHLQTSRSSLFNSQPVYNRKKNVHERI